MKFGMRKLESSGKLAANGHSTDSLESQYRTRMLFNSYYPVLKRKAENSLKYTSAMKVLA